MSEIRPSDAARLAIAAEQASAGSPPPRWWTVRFPAATPDVPGPSPAARSERSHAAARGSSTSPTRWRSRSPSRSPTPWPRWRRRPSIIAPLWLILVLAVLALPVWVAIFTAYNLYERQNRSISLATFDELGELFHALLAGLAPLPHPRARCSAASWARRSSSRSRRRCSWPPRSRWCCSSAARCGAGCFRDHGPRRTLIVGAGDVGQVVERKIRSHPEYGLELVGFVDDERRRRAAGRRCSARPRTCRASSTSSRSTG